MTEKDNFTEQALKVLTLHQTALQKGDDLLAK